jgi:hypothetical protein
MLDTQHVFQTTAEVNAVPSFRDRLPTLPHDLSEYARVQTGPSSWSAHPDVEVLSAWALEAHDDPMRSLATDLFLDISPTDVPHLAATSEEVARLVTHREAFVAATIDGASSLETMLDSVDLPTGEVLAIICNLCARGIVVLDRSQRLHRR